MVSAQEQHARSQHEHDDPHVIQPFPERYQTALDNPRLAANVTRYQRNWRVNRDTSFEEVEFERLRTEFKATKTRVQDRLDDYLAQFQKAAEETGAIVHHAGNARDANRSALEICRAHEAQQIVKSKSMVTEEIELNHCLEARVSSASRPTSPSGSSRRPASARATSSVPRCTW